MIRAARRFCNSRYFKRLDRISQVEEALTAKALLNNSLASCFKGSSEITRESESCHKEMTNQEDDLRSRE